MDRASATPVREPIRLLLGQISDHTFRRQVTERLERYPNALHPQAPFRSAMLAEGAFQAAGGAGLAGVWAGAAMEMLAAAVHLLDDLSDGDRQASPADLQIAPALLLLSDLSLERARQEGRRAGAAETDWSPVIRQLLAVGAGQMMDVDLEGQAGATLDQAVTMTVKKTGAYGEALALAGAIAAGANPELQSELGRAGQYLAVRGQLIDDASDASMAAPNTSDICLRKKTVPIVFFMSCRGDRSDWDILRDRFSSGSLTPGEERRFRLAIDESGAVQLTLTLASWYRMKADEVLGNLQGKGCDVALLRLFETELGSHGPRLEEFISIQVA